MEYYKNLSLEDLFYIDDEGVIRCEEWRDIVGYEGSYLVSNLGRVKSLERVLYNPKGGGTRVLKLRIMRSCKSARGYISTGLSNGNKTYCFKIHRLVAKSFVPNPNDLLEVNHIDTIKHNNKPNNLEWCTSLDNVKHAILNGLWIDRKGEKNRQSKLKESDVLEIRKSNLPQRKLAKIYNVSQSIINSVRMKTTWKHI